MIPGHLGSQRARDNVCAVNDELWADRAWGVYSDEGKPLLSQGYSGWKEALDNLAGRL
jgi:hypothetical protein